LEEKDINQTKPDIPCLVSQAIAFTFLSHLQNGGLKYGILA
jgi:hypothetical protein